MLLSCRKKILETGSIKMLHLPSSAMCKRSFCGKKIESLRSSLLSRISLSLDTAFIHRRRALSEVSY